MSAIRYRFCRFACFARGLLVPKWNKLRSVAAHKRIVALQHALRRSLRRHQSVIGLTQKIQALSLHRCPIAPTRDNDSVRKSKELRHSPR
jgi:hypothetical protein